MMMMMMMMMMNYDQIPIKTFKVENHKEIISIYRSPKIYTQIRYGWFMNIRVNISRIKCRHCQEYAKIKILGRLIKTRHIVIIDIRIYLLYIIIKSLCSEK